MPQEAKQPPRSRVEQAGRASELRILELEAQLSLLREQKEQVCLILDSAAEYAIVTLDVVGRVTSWSKGAQAIMGYAEADILGRSGEVVFTAEDRSSGRFDTELRLAAETGRACNQRWHLRRNGSRFWASGLMMPLMDTDGRPKGFLNILRDRTAAQAAIERRELLMGEMKHRMNNTFAMVQAVAAQTRRYTQTAAEFGAVFAARLSVLARSSDLLIHGDSQEASLREMIQSALVIHDDEPGRITIKGPSVLLGASLALTVGLYFHELATNAVKYGALSSPGGRVEVSWATSQLRCDARMVEIVWRECGGPKVVQPIRRGFGSKLLEKSVPSGGTVKLDFHPDGLECRMCLPTSDSADFLGQTA